MTTRGIGQATFNLYKPNLNHVHEHRLQWPSHHDLAEDPKNIEKIIKIDLPDIAKTESSYYRDPPAPSLDVYTHDITFVEELSEECIKELEERFHTSVYWEY